MKEARSDLGIAKVLKPETQGPPGRRTFRLVVAAEKGSASIWMEKEQLSALALTIRRLLDELSDEESSPEAEPVDSVAEPSFDFKVSNLGLAYDEGRRMLAVLAYAAEDHDSDQPTLSCWISRAKARSLAGEALDVVAGGIKSNGHRPFDDEL